MSDYWVYSLVIEVKIESMFDNGKERMIRTTDIFKFVWVCRGIRWGLKDEPVNQDLNGEGVGSGERRKGELWNEKYDEVRFCEWISWQYLQHLKSNNMRCHLRTNKLYRAHAFELIQCYRSEFWWGGDAKQGLHIPGQDECLKYRSEAAGRGEPPHA